MAKILVILGSTRPGRNGKYVADWYMSHAKDFEGLDVEMVDLAERDLPLLDEPKPPAMHDYQHDHTKAWAAKVDEADGYVFITPEYNHSTSAALKNAIDYVGQEWHRKAVAIVSYGGSGRGYRAAEHLRQIAAELKMASIRYQIGINLFDGTLQEDGSIDESKLDANVNDQLTDLKWWVGALKAARS